MKSRSLCLALSIVSLAACWPAAARVQEQPSVADAAREQAAMERALQEFRDRAKRSVTEDLARTRQQLTTLREQASRFQQRLDTLKTSDEGKRLAADPTAVTAIYHKGLERPAVDAGQVEGRLAEVERAGERIATATDPGALDTAIPAARDLLAEARAWATLRGAQLAEQVRWLDAAIARAPALAEPAKAPTLAQALDAYAVEYDRWAADRFKAGVEQARQEAETELVERGRLAALLQAEQKLRLMEDRARMLLDEERAMHQAEMERKREEIARLDREMNELRARRALEDAKAATAASAIQNEALREELRRRCNDPQVQADLIPFTGSGYFQPTKGTNGRGKRGIEKGPMSLNAIGASGALSPSESGLKTLLYIAAHEDNERPDWGIRYRSESTLKRLTDEEMDLLQRAQKHLQELGPTMVELGMLAK